MAVGTLSSNAMGIRPAGRHTVPTRAGRAASGQTWKVGAVLLRSSGELIEASADPVADIVGIAASNVTSAAANQVVPYWPVTPFDEFEATLEDQTNENHAFVETNLYTDYALQVDSGGNWYIDENDTTNTAAMVISATSESDLVAGKVRARVVFRFLADVLASQT